MRRALLSLLPLLSISAFTFSNAVALPAGESARIGSYKSPAEGFFTNSYWVEGPQGIVVFDTQFLPALAHELVLKIQSQTQAPLRFALNLHANPDKFNGNGTLVSEGARIVTNRATYSAQPAVDAAKRAFWSTIPTVAAVYPRFVPFAEPADVFSGARTIDLGGDVKVELRELHQSGVSAPQTVAILRRTGLPTAVFVGDLVHTRTHAWLENGTPLAWRTSLAEVAYLVPEGGVVYPGRGEPAPFAATSGALEEQKRYLGVFSRAFRDARRAVGDSRAARLGFVKQRLAAAFPDYAMPELTDFSLPADIDE